MNEWIRIPQTEPLSAIWSRPPFELVFKYKKLDIGADGYDYLEEHEIPDWLDGIMVILDVGVEITYLGRHCGEDEMGGIFCANAEQWFLDPDNKIHVDNMIANAEQMANEFMVRLKEDFNLK